MAGLATRQEPKPRTPTDSGQVHENTAKSPCRIYERDSGSVLPE